MLQRFLVTGGVLVICAAILALSFWRLTFPQPSRYESLKGSVRPAGERLAELVTLPFLPDNPLYVLRMIQERLALLSASKQAQTNMNIAYADERLATAKLLLDKGRVSLAVSTVTKAEKYLLTAAYDIHRMPAAQRDTLTEKLMKTTATHRDELVAMKPHLSDEQRATIDSLLEQLAVVSSNR